MRIRKIISKIKRFLYSYKETLLIIFILLILAELIIRIFFSESRTIIYPSAILLSYKEAVKEGLFVHVALTILRTVGSFIIASFIGISLGVLIGTSKKATKSFTPIIDFFRPLPSSAIIPWAMMFIGLNEFTNIFVIVFGGIWPILIGTINGVADVNIHMLDSINQFSLTKYQKLKWFTLPEASSEILTGLKISISICLILSVTVELIGGFNDGIGKYLKQVEDGANYKLMYFSIFVIALTGFMLNKLFNVIEKHVSWVKYKYKIHK